MRRRSETQANTGLARIDKKTRVYDKPRTPHQRVLDTGVMTAETAAAFAEPFENTDLAALTRQITRIQTRLIDLAKDKTNATTTTISRATIDEAPKQISRAS